MPHVITPEPDVLRLDFSGVLTREALFAMLADVEAAERTYDHAPARLTIIGDVEGRVLTAHDMSALAARRRATPLRNPIRSAFVATRAVSIGFVRMFQMLNDHPQIRIEIFGSEEAARAWLRAPERGIQPP